MDAGTPPPILTAIDANIFTVTINRPERRNAVDRKTADALAQAFAAFDKDDDLSVAILTSAGKSFCAGADLQAIATGAGNQMTPPSEGTRLDGPMGPTRMQLTKPVIAAIEGHAVAGGLELALWCDLRVAAENAVFGVYCRRFGVPLIDGGTIRLPRLIGQARALDMILTGRAVDAEEAFSWGLASRICGAGKAIQTATELAKSIAANPQICMRNDRMSALQQWSLEEKDALTNEFTWGARTLESGETITGATKFLHGAGRHGATLSTKENS